MSAPMPRRQFLAQGAVGAAALATASGVRALESPNQKIVLGVMGTNGRGSALAVGLSRMPGCEVAYIIDPDQRAIDKASKAVADQGAGKPTGVKDYRKVLDDKSVDALAIATPDHWHAPATIAACAAGKHVYVEKPASHNGREGEMMIAAARKHDRVVQLGTQRRSSKGFTEAIRRVREGEIGDVLFARGWINSTRPSIGHGKQVPVPEYLDYSLWQGPAPEKPYMSNVIHYHWHWFWHWGTGELGNNGIHALDLVRWGLGVDYPERVICGGGKFHFEDDQQTPDTQIATFHFGDKAANWEHRTWHRRGFEGSSWGVTFYGEEGAMVLTSSTAKTYDMRGKERNTFAVDVGQTEHFENFLNGIREGEKLNAEIEEGVKSTALCHLGNIAYRTGRTVNFDPAKGGIRDDAEQQQQLWGREYRPGWEPQV